MGSKSGHSTRASEGQPVNSWPPASKRISSMPQIVLIAHDGDEIVTTDPVDLKPLAIAAAATSSSSIRRGETGSTKTDDIERVKQCMITQQLRVPGSDRLKYVRASTAGRRYRSALSDYESGAEPPRRQHSGVTRCR